MPREAPRYGGISAQGPVALDQPSALVGVQPELETRSCNIPGYVLATRKEVVIVVVNRIRLQVACVRTDPLVR